MLEGSRYLFTEASNAHMQDIPSVQGSHSDGGTPADGSIAVKELDNDAVVCRIERHV